ncbi:hypothetical protein ACIRPQ_02510 [Streptomyces sp. NPDC101213]|uniref:hypothetical protein n=1 Tax=Streptomyces TaxID=1883 RepID=UPI00167D0966|nr:hypothetical protein [Streptomyces griseoflavus]
MLFVSFSTTVRRPIMVRVLVMLSVAAPRSMSDHRRQQTPAGRSPITDSSSANRRSPFIAASKAPTSEAFQLNGV